MIEAINAGAVVETLISVDSVALALRPVRVLTGDDGRVQLASVPVPSSTLHTVFDLPEF